MPRTLPSFADARAPQPPAPYVPSYELSLSRSSLMAASHRALSTRSNWRPGARARRGAWPAPPPAPGASCRATHAATASAAARRSAASAAARASAARRLSLALRPRRFFFFGGPPPPPPPAARRFFSFAGARRPAAAAAPAPRRARACVRINQ